MGDSEDKYGLVSRTAKLFNKSDFSDVVIYVKDGYRNEKFYAHKLILAMASGRFSSLLYAQSNASDNIKISDFNPDTVGFALRYLYCDELNVTSINEAIDVLRFARKYVIMDLVKVCMSYIGFDKMTIGNVFRVYEIALKENMDDILLECQNFVCNYTKDAFASAQFCEISLPVLQDILKQRYLTVSSELDVIHAVLRWCKYECKKKGRPYEGLCIRESISPVLPYLRFLSLSAEEYCDFVEENNIFTGHESSIITRKILQPSSSIRVPGGFCSINRPRESRTSQPNTAITKSEIKYNEHERSSGNFDNFSCIAQDVQPPTYAFEENQYNLLDIKPSYKNVPKQSTIIDYVEKQNVLDTAVLKPQTKYSPQESGLFNHQKLDSPQYQHAKSDIPLYQLRSNKPSPVLKVMPQINNSISSQRTFDFPLQDVQKGIGSLGHRDLKCSVVIKIVKGALSIHGVILKVMNLLNDSDEIMDVYLSLSGNFGSKDHKYSEKLNNSNLPIIFSEPLKLIQKDSAEIEITIESLKLNRCNISKVENVELNCGLSMVAEISLKSNQMNGRDGFFFLISRLIYTQP